MTKRIRLIKAIIITSVVISIMIIIAIIINSPYYPGFERGLFYLSPDLSENRSVIRDSVVIKNTSKIKIIFERKDYSISYDKYQFDNFIKSLEIQIWNDNEYFELDSSKLQFFDSYPDVYLITIGELKSRGKYFINIKSDHGINGAYNIGIGIGKDSRVEPLGKNKRLFY